MTEEVNKPNIEELLPPKTNTPTQIKKPIIATTIKKPITKPLQKKPSAPQAPETQKEPIKKIKPQYRYAGKETITQVLTKIIPKQFIPTNRLATILGYIFLATLILTLFQFPFGKLMSGDTSMVIKIGYPLPFLELGIIETGDSPLRLKGLILDLILYLILAYAIDVIINLTLDTKIIKSKDDLKKKPTVFKKPKPTVADKLTKKVFE